jgi:hypothetical protein
MYDTISQGSMLPFALHKWLGLIGYRLLGHRGHLLPT